MHEKLLARVREVARDLGLPPEDEARITVTPPPEEAQGDAATNAALLLARARQQSPREAAEALVARLGALPQVAKVAIAGPGFVNFFFTRDFFSLRLRAAVEDPEAWGAGKRYAGQNIIVEHTQPNPFKPFHIGHLMSNAIGECVARLIGNEGANLKRANYQGDIGLHVAKALWGLKKLGLAPENVEVLGRAYAYGHEHYENDPAAQKEIIALNKMGYEKISRLPLYQEGKKVSLAHFEEIYAMLGTRFDYYFFESECEPVGRALVHEGLAKGVFEESDGAVVYRGEKVGLHTRVFITRHGTTTYETRELGLAVLKYDAFPFDLNLTTVAVEQDTYFRVVRAALAELRSELAARYRHIPHGMLQLISGKMSSRKGNVITGEALLNSLLAAVREKMREREFESEAARTQAERAVAVAAIKYQVLRQAIGKNIIFDPERALSFEGDSGPYLQYAHTRACALLRRGAEEGVAPSLEGVLPQEAPSLERLVARFPEVAARAAGELEPHHLTTYLTEVASAFHRWYAAEKIVDARSAESPYRLALTAGVAHTLRRGLSLLGMEAPERM